MAGSAATRREAADVLVRLLAMIEDGELDAPEWMRHRLRGAIIGLDPDRTRPR